MINLSISIQTLRLSLFVLSGLGSLILPLSAADSVVAASTPAALGANDSIDWAQLGPDSTVLPASFTISSTGSPQFPSFNASVNLGGEGSMVSVACPPMPQSCASSWGTSNITPGNSVLWTSSNVGGGNGPVTFSFYQRPIKGIGFYIQPNLRGKFTAQLVAKDSQGQDLGTFQAAGGDSGDAVFLGILDQTAANIGQITVSITSSVDADNNDICAETCADFAIDKIALNVIQYNALSFLTINSVGVYADNQPTRISALTTSGLSPSAQVILTGPDGRKIQAPQLTVTDGSIPGQNIWIACSFSLPGTWTATIGISSGAVGTAQFNIGVPAPVLAYVTPAAAVAGSQGSTITLYGSSFSGTVKYKDSVTKQFVTLPPSTVFWNGVPLATTFVSSSQLTAIVPANLLSAPGIASITVSNSTQTSRSLTIEITVPSIGPSFLPAKTISLPGSGNASSIGTGNFFGRTDGTLDLVVGRSSTGTAAGPVYLLKGDGAGSFQTVTPTFLDGGAGGKAVFNPLAVSALGYGTSDLIIAGDDTHPGSPTLQIFSNKGSGTFSPVSTQGSASYSAVTAADVFQEGTPAYVAARYDLTGGGAVVGVDTFHGQAGPSGGYYPLAIAVGHFSPNGRPGIAVANSCGVDINCSPNSKGNVTLMSFGYQNAPDWASKITYAVGIQPVALATGNFSGHTEATDDIAVLNNCGPACANGNFAILKNDGAGNFVLGPSIQVGYYPVAIVAGDFNGDGFPDLAVGNQGDNSIQIFQNDGAGNFNLARTIGGFNAVAGLVAGDFNRDGRLDIASINQGDGTVSILLQRAPVATTLAVSAPATPYGSPSSVQVTVTPAGGSPTDVVSGTISLSVDGGTPVTSSNTGKATFNLGILSAGAHSLTAAFTGQATASSVLGASTAIATLSVQPIALSISITAPPVAAGSTATITVALHSVQGNPTGSVQLVVDQLTPVTQPVDANGNAVFSVPSLAAGSHAISAVYVPTGNFGAISTTSTLTVTGGACTYSLSSTTAPAAQGGASGSFTVNTQSGCSWSATSGAPSWLTITPATASGTGTGTVSYTAAANSGAARSGTITVQAQTFTVTQAGTSVNPTATVLPISGSGSSQSFTFTFNDPNGYADIAGAGILVNATLSGPNSCYVLFARPDIISLVDDSGTAAAGHVTSTSLGAPAVLQNSQCVVLASQTSEVGSGNTLQFVLTIVFKSSFAGAKSVWANVNNVGGQTDGFQQLGSFNVTAQSQALAATTVSPASGTGQAQAFTFSYTDPNGAPDISGGRVVFNSGFTLAGGCYLLFDAANNISLASDDGNSIIGTAKLGKQTAMENSQCTVFPGNSYQTQIGQTLNLTVFVAFKPSFAGTKNIYSDVQNNAGTRSAFPQLGTYTVSASTPLAVNSVNPASATGPSQSFSFVYSDPNGYADIASTQVIINSSSSTTNSCVITLNRGAGSIALTTDGGGATAAGLGQATTLSNSQCIVNAASSSQFGFGNYLTLTLFVTMNSTGSRNVYSKVTSNAPATVGPVQLGAWNVTTPSFMTPVSVSPFTGAGPAGTQLPFTFTLSNPAGASDISGALIVLYPSLQGASACYILWGHNNNLVSLASDDATTFTSAAAGAPSLLSNSQCTVDTSQSFSVQTGNTVNLTLSVSFKGVYQQFAQLYSWVNLQNAAHQLSGWSLLSRFSVQ